MKVLPGRMNYGEKTPKRGADIKKSEGTAVLLLSVHDHFLSATVAASSC